MKRTDKTKYLSPECEVVECRLQGVLAASTPVDPDYNSPFREEEEWS